MVFKRLIVLSVIVLFSFVAVCNGAGIPKPLKARFVLGEPVWRELPVRDDLQNQYDKVWQTLLNTILEHNYDIATMEKSSGYFRTNWNERVVVLTGNWYYKLQITVKLIMPSDDLSKVEKIRLQVTGDITNLDKHGMVKASFRGYDQIILENLIQDIQAKIGLR